MKHVGMTSPRRTSKGYTLVELLVVIAILVILAGIAGLQARDWIGRSGVEQQTRQLYSDLVNARTRAMNRGRIHFVVVTTASNSYQIREDTDPAPDGDGARTAADALVMQATTKLPFQGLTEFRINTQGLLSASGSLRVENTYNAVVDCVGVSPTRIRMGKWNGTDCIP